MAVVAPRIGSGPGRTRLRGGRVTPSAFDRVVNPTAWQRWQDAVTRGIPLAYCGGCVNPGDHESDCRGNTAPSHYADAAWAYYGGQT